VPELPEAETIVRGLRPHLEGRRLVRVEFLAPRVSRDAAELFEGLRVEQVRRYGKQVELLFEAGARMRIKLGMTGALLWMGQPGCHTRARLEIEGGGVLLFDDIRQFGSIEWGGDSRLGPDPFEISEIEFARRLRRRSTQVKRALLDQSLIRGLGNIYTDEALFRARIDPRARTRRLTLERACRLHREIVALLNEAIECRGSSVSDYVDAAGERGGFQWRHQVYRKTGQPCPRCGSPIQRIVLAQRGTHFCPRCQAR
jgi:formamidopyrimidine-DNA glycosylase